MSDPPQVILLDSNAYFRLARSIHPLLRGVFGNSPKYSLFVLSDLDDEFRSSSRLQTKFEWVKDAQYRDDRVGKRYTCRGKPLQEVDNAFSYLAKYAHENALSVSREDLRALAVGHVRVFSVVSDDRDMRAVADAHEIDCWPTVKLLKLMVTTGRTDLAKVTEILEYLDHENDLPMSKTDLRRQFKQYFQTNCPI